MEAVREHWLEQLYTDHYEGVFRFVCSILRDTSEAEDVVQDTFLKAHAAYGTYFSCGKERPGCSRSPGAPPTTTCGGSAASSPMRGIWGALPLPRRGDRVAGSCWTGCRRWTGTSSGCTLWRGLTHQETARVLGRTVHGVKKRYERAIRALREQFEEGSS